MVKYYIVTLIRVFFRMGKLNYLLQYLMILIYRATGRRFSLIQNFRRMWLVAEI